MDVARVARVAQLFSKKTPTIPLVYASFTIIELLFSKTPSQIFQLRT
ncbi:MAG: hypothetical protein JWR19_1215 [Pedosphaera sp.]|nr:hypothetical protein [Pedosphaera sp.]